VPLRGPDVGQRYNGFAARTSPNTVKFNRRRVRNSGEGRSGQSAALRRLRLKERRQRACSASGRAQG